MFQPPQSPTEIDANIPLPLSNMILKLMEKNVDLRYQSAKGIMYDMDLIISEYEPGVELLLAERDISDTLIKLYGRKNEYNALVGVYNRITTTSSFELVFVHAGSGIGKTTLVLELNKLVTQHGVFIYGKYDCSKSEPYSALIEAVEMLCNIILLQDKSTIEKYRTLIQNAVGEDGKLLTKVIDNLKNIVGEQPDTFDSFGVEAKIDSIMYS